MQIAPVDIVRVAGHVVQLKPLSQEAQKYIQLAQRFTKFEIR